jgi:uncharacterized phage-associated protein
MSPKHHSGTKTPESGHPHTASEIAEYIVRLATAHGDDISPMKLQKILYYAQGAFLALKGEPIFDDEMHALPHGPVVLSVYEEYKKFGDKPIDRKTCDNADLSDVEKTALNELYKKYRSFTASELRNKTHGETPWADTQKNHVISKDRIKVYFKDNIYADNLLFKDIPIEYGHTDSSGIVVFADRI